MSGFLAGVNLDRYHPGGHPDPAYLKSRGIKIVRLLYNVSRLPNQEYGNDDLMKSHDVYKPYISALHEQGIKITLVTTHQSCGAEKDAGQPGYYNWKQMTDSLWREYGVRHADYAGGIASLYPGMIYAMQVGNEHDAASESSIYMPPAHYGTMFNKTYDKIKAVDGAIKVILHGAVGGPGSGMQYFHKSGINRLSAVAYHPYMAAAARTGKFPGKSDKVTYEMEDDEWAKLGVERWVTEWGILNFNQTPGLTEAMGIRYFEDMWAALRDRVAVAMMYGWRDGMHNGFGMVKGDGTPREGMFAPLTLPGDGGSLALEPGRYAITAIANGINFRSGPAKNAPVLAQLVEGARVTILAETPVVADGYTWYNTLVNGTVGWIARLPFAKFTELPGTFDAAAVALALRQLADAIEAGG